LKGVTISRQISVAVCVITYRRPEGLGRLLEAFTKLDVDPEAIVPTFVIVDNDAEESARAVVEGAAELTRLVYAVEPERGIPFARNRAVREAAGCDFVVFIDDDEIPEPAWLTELVATQQRTGADVVTGPVLPVFEEPPAAWVDAGGFFERPRFPPDAVIPYATTSSVLISRPLLDRYPKPFNEAMRFTGGTDTHLFLRLHKDGAVIVWADGAVVSETFPASRTTLRWILARQYRRGNTLSLCHVDLDPSMRRRLRLLANGGYTACRGAALTLLGAFRGRVQLVRGLQVVWLGAGLLTGAFRLGYNEYKTVHGR
jgi:succinoglycan biosynthesis protein ExoM